MNVKIPIELIQKHCSDERGGEIPYVQKVGGDLLKYMSTDYLKEGPEFAEYLAELGLDPEETSYRPYRGIIRIFANGALLQFCRRARKGVFYDFCNRRYSRGSVPV